MFSYRKFSKGYSVVGQQKVDYLFRKRNEAELFEAINLRQVKYDENNICFLIQVISGTQSYGHYLIKNLYRFQSFLQMNLQASYHLESVPENFVFVN